FISFCFGFDLFDFFFYSVCMIVSFFFFFSSRRRHTRCSRDWGSDVCSSDLRRRMRGDGRRALVLRQCPVRRAQGLQQAGDLRDGTGHAAARRVRVDGGGRRGGDARHPSGDVLREASVREPGRARRRAEGGRARRRQAGGLVGGGEGGLDAPGGGARPVALRGKTGPLPVPSEEREAILVLGHGRSEGRQRRLCRGGRSGVRRARRPKVTGESAALRFAPLHPRMGLSCLKKKRKSESWPSRRG